MNSLIRCKTRQELMQCWFHKDYPKILLFVTLLCTAFMCTRIPILEINCEKMNSAYQLADDGTYRYPPCSLIYDGIIFLRIDRVMVDSALCHVVKSDLVQFSLALFRPFLNHFWGTFVGFQYILDELIASLCAAAPLGQFDFGRPWNILYVDHVQL